MRMCAMRMCDFKDSRYFMFFQKNFLVFFGLKLWLKLLRNHVLAENGSNLGTFRVLKNKSIQIKLRAYRVEKN